MKQYRYCHGKRVYKREQLELTIPSRFRGAAEQFLDKPLIVEAKAEGASLIIEARLLERAFGAPQNPPQKPGSK